MAADIALAVAHCMRLSLTGAQATWVLLAGSFVPVMAVAIGGTAALRSTARRIGAGVLLAIIIETCLVSVNGLLIFGAVTVGSGIH